MCKSVFVRAATPYIRTYMAECVCLHANIHIGNVVSDKISKNVVNKSSCVILHKRLPSHQIIHQHLSTEADNSHLVLKLIRVQKVPILNLQMEETVLIGEVSQICGVLIGEVS